MNASDKKLDKAVRNPTAVYQTPDEVLKDRELDRDAKRAILRSWELDARELAVAEAENMAEGEPNMLARVLAALAQIDEATVEKEAESPKVPTVHGSAPQGGVTRPVGPDPHDKGETDMTNPEKPNPDSSRNEGEGSRSAAREYNKDQQEFVKSGKVGKAAEKAKKAIESKEGEDLRKAEEQGRSHAKEQDPAIRRDYGKATR